MKAITREEKIISGENLTPITRKEMFLAKASGQNVQTPTPITREEYFLNKITGGGGTSTNEPTAYTVSSVDELPKNAVDGSLAIVEVEGTSEVWVFYDELDNLGESYTAWYDEETSNCISPFIIGYSNYDMGIVIGESNKVWKEFSVGTSGPSSWGIYVLNAFDDEIGATVSLYTHNPNGDYGFPHGWEDDKFKTIQVHYADEEAKQWLEAHATSLGKAIIRELYTRQNGEWVYTGEVA